MKDIPTILTIFGATGDLMAKKITPALYSLFKSGELPYHFKVIGFARRDFGGDKFNQLLADNLHQYLKVDDIDPKFYEMFEYHQGQLDDVNSYRELKTKFENYDRQNNISSNKLFFYSIAPELYSLVTQNVVSIELKKEKTRLIIEKPFGHDENSAVELEQEISKNFNDNQVYLIDHYLGKGILRYINEFKNSPEFKPLWNKENIRKVEISTLEEVGLEGRGAFYETVGALKDVGQNHLLEIIALLTASEDSKKSRAGMIDKLKKYSEQEIKNHTFRAQYDGYKNIENVDPNSNVETYFKLKTYLDDENWLTVPFILEAGKKFSAKNTKITIYFQDFQIVFNIYPEKEINKISSNGTKETLKHFNHIGYQYVEEYATLIKESIMGIQDYFVGVEEVLAAWRFTDPIEKAWKENVVPLHFYKPGSSEILKEANKHLNSKRS